MRETRQERTQDSTVLGNNRGLTRGDEELNKVEVLPKLNLFETVAVFKNSTLVRSSFSGNHFTAGQVDS